MRMLSLPSSTQSFNKQERCLIEMGSAQMSAQERAEVIRSSLDPNMFPSFVKLMLPSHVAGCFWLGLPKKFSDLNLPKEDVEITLLDEDGKEYLVKYLPRKWGLSGGWRGFSIAHNLATGDALVFQLVKVTKFKVYIVRAQDSAEVNGAMGLLKLEACSTGNDPDNMVTESTENPERKRQKILPLAVVQSENQNISSPLSGPDHPETHSEEVSDPEVFDGIKLSDSVVQFQDIKNLESFTITVNGLILDSEMSEHVRAKYYELCCSQNCFLHEQLLQGLNYKLVSGIISETVNIADAIKASKLSTFKDNKFEIWKKCLKAFRELGMNVEFLLARLEKLVNLGFESKQAMDWKKYTEAVNRRSQVEEKIRILEMNLGQLKDELKGFEEGISTLRVKAEEHELTFQAKVSAPW